MFIPFWLVVIVIIVVFFVYKSKEKQSNLNIPEKITIDIENIEENVSFLKELLFSLEHFDSPHFIDLQDTFDTMEINYLRLKQRFSHDEEKKLEIIKDWYTYVEALRELKSARVMMDVDWEDGAWDRADERSKEPSIIKDEVEKKFKSLLSKDWQEIPPDYFKRMESTKEPNKKDRAKYESEDKWKYYYLDSANLLKLEEKRKKALEQSDDAKSIPEEKAEKEEWDIPDFLKKK